MKLNIVLPEKMDSSCFYEFAAGCLIENRGWRRPIKVIARIPEGATLEIE